jgi:alpha-tubulin suppressor-like RCC1 family protein
LAKALCALLEYGSVDCWGYGGDGELGGGGPVGTADFSTVPIPTLAFSNVTALASGWYQNCVIKTDAHVWCWGANNTGQVGDGTTTDGSSPTEVQHLP